MLCYADVARDRHAVRSLDLLLGTQQCFRRKEAGGTYRNITLARKGIVYVRDLLQNGAISKDIFKLIAPSWQKLYKAVRQLLLRLGTQPVGSAQR